MSLHYPLTIIFRFGDKMFRAISSRVSRSPAQEFSLHPDRPSRNLDLNSAQPVASQIVTRNVSHSRSPPVSHRRATFTTQVSLLYSSLLLRHESLALRQSLPHFPSTSFRPFSVVLDHSTNSLFVFGCLLFPLTDSLMSTIFADPLSGTFCLYTSSHPLTSASRRNLSGIVHLCSLHTETSRFNSCSVTFWSVAAVCPHLLTPCCRAQQPNNCELQSSSSSSTTSEPRASLSASDSSNFQPSSSFFPIILLFFTAFLTKLPGCSRFSDPCQSQLHVSLSDPLLLLDLTKLRFVDLFLGHLFVNLQLRLGPSSLLSSSSTDCVCSRGCSFRPSFSSINFTSFHYIREASSWIVTLNVNSSSQFLVTHSAAVLAGSHLNIFSPSFSVPG